MIIKCNCSHHYQDEKYGFNNRIGNITKNKTVRCTVCKSEVKIKDSDLTSEVVKEISIHKNRKKI